MDIDFVLSWPASKLQGWLTYLAVNNDLEAEAYKRAADQAKRNARNGITN